MTSIESRGVRTHNLKGIDVDVPKHRLVAFTGVSGRSTFVLDTKSFYGVQFNPSADCIRNCVRPAPLRMQSIKDLRALMQCPWLPPQTPLGLHNPFIMKYLQV